MGQVVESLVVQYDVSEGQIALLGEEVKGVTFDTPANYEVGRLALGKLRSLRTAVEKRRQDLKRESLDYGRRVDAAAKHFTGLIEAIENPIAEAKRAVDEEEARAKREAERAELIALEAEQTRKREEAEAAAKAVREAEEKRLEEGRRALEAEKARNAEAIRVSEEANRVERERIAAERAALDAERRQVEETARKAREADEARARAAREAAAREQAKADAEAVRARLEALRPEREKVHAFAGYIRQIADQAPEVESELCVGAIAWVQDRLRAVADKLDQFDGTGS
jgi:chromosome segregation ATPase